MPRARPRSVKQSVILHRRGSLGDSSDGSTDDSSVERTISQGEKENLSPRTRRTTLGRSRYSEFHTPDIEEYVTDYGLEFTTSNIQNPSPRRCSTFRQVSSQEEQQTSPQRIRRRMQQQQQQSMTVTQEANKQNAKNVRKQTGNRKSNDDEDSASNRSHLRERQQHIATTQSRGRKSVASSKETTEQQQQARKQQKHVAADSDTDNDVDEEGEEEEEEEEGETEGRDNTTSQNTVKRRGRPPKQQSAKTATTTSGQHEHSRQMPSTSKAAAAAKSANQQQQPAVALKKPRKQKNPLQKERRFWREVQKLQNRTDHLIPRLPFSRVIREIMMNASPDIRQISATALEALQTASEMYLTQRLQDAYLLTLHRGRVTLDARDMELIQFLKLNFN